MYNFKYLKFLIAKTWYNWITSYSTNVVEVTVIQGNIAQDLSEDEIVRLHDGSSKGYLGYEFFQIIAPQYHQINQILQ